MSNVGGVSYNNAQSTAQTSTVSDKTANTTAKEKEAASQNSAGNQDAYVPTKVTTEKSRVYDAATVQKLQDQVNASKERLLRMVAKMIGGKDTGNNPSQRLYAMLANPDDYSLNVDDETRAEAQQMISEDGEYGVKATTDRIMSFAKALGGENADDETIEMLRDAFLEGFNEVANMFGGFDKMPDVSKQTHDSIMKEFDSWKSGKSVETGSVQA